VAERVQFMSRTKGGAPAAVPAAAPAFAEESAGSSDDDVPF
jgi:hypothetical protein